MDNDHAFNSGSVRPSTSPLSELATAGDHFLQEQDPAAVGNICGVSSLDYAGVGWTGVVVRARQTAAQELEFENIEALWVTYAANPADPAAEYALAVRDGELTAWVEELDAKMERSETTADGHPMPPLKVSDGPSDIELEEPVDTDSVRQLLTAEYVTWNEAQGLSLGSADEHLFDNRLTLDQLTWVRDFCDRWDSNEQVADAARPRP